ncbi:addiction module antidote protein, HigA family [Paraflavitalea soli]|uniref:Addiction module antidote protein, HigA family n=2 Tax=Paraflavitalea soli TaxID=2315862 RepID=A0A3B7NAR1_9BACT|nr:addiction module antidote protein, HigA family [Paraflavitalea soli]
MLKRELPPSHPGVILRELFMKERNLTVTELAKGLGMTRANLSAIINMRAGISPEVAVKLSEAFGNSAAFWINLQNNYELWHAERKVKRSSIQHFRLPGSDRQSAHAQ